MKNGQPPRWATRLLHWLGHPDTREEVQGDLLELYAHWVKSLGTRRANWRYALSALRLLRPLAKPNYVPEYSSPFFLHPDMFRSYLTIAFRQLWRNRLYTSLNVVGLAIGLSACWVIFQLVSYQLSFNKGHANADHIYRVVSEFTYDGKPSGNRGVPKPLGGTMRTQVAGVDLAVPLERPGEITVVVPAAVSSGKPLTISDVNQVNRTTPDYFKLLHYQWLVGDPANALAAPGKVVLTQSRLQQYFPRLTPQQALGQRLTYITYNSDTTRTEVAGVVADLTFPTDFDGKEFLSIVGDTLYTSAEEWGSTNSDNQLFVRLTPAADPTRVAQQASAWTKKNATPLLKKCGLSSDDAAHHLLQPLPEIHFITEYGASISLSFLYGLMGLALFILLLAVINYVNLTTAQIPQRSREIGVRKTLGSSSGALIGQFLGETALVTLLALVLALPLSSLMMSAFADLIPTGTTDYLKIGPAFLFLVVLVLIVSIVAGLYPGWLITQLQPARVLRGGSLFVSNPGGRLTLRKGLIVFQFVIAQVFIVGAIIIGQQLHFAFTQDLGFTKQAILTVQVPLKFAWNDKSPLKNRHFVLRDEYAQLPGVAAVSLGSPPFIPSFSSGQAKSRGRKGQEIMGEVQRKFVDTTWLGLYDIKLLAGRNLYPSDTAREWVINETALKTFDLGTPQEAIGKVLTEGNKQYPIVGVVRDFNTMSFSQKINPVAMMSSKQSLYTLNIKLASTNPADWPDVLKGLEKTWKKAYPEEAFSYKFSDDLVSSFYHDERNMARIINLATGVAILISCLGLFGLATLTAFQRTKEIGIRKVLGASIASVVGLLSREFVTLVGVAILIATPVAAWLAHRWLENYAYKIDLAWWLFAGAAAVALLIALLTVSFQSIKAALMNPVKSLRSE